MKTGRYFFFWLSVALFLSRHSGLMAEDADALYLRLHARYDTVESLRADFTQTMSWSVSEEGRSHGGVIILQGEKYRIETGAELLVFNGVETYIYRPGEQQVLINDVIEDEGAFSPFAFFLQPDRFTVLDAESIFLYGEKHYRLNVKPKDEDSFLTEVTIWMRDRDDLITRLRVQDVNETKMMFELTNIEVNPVLDDDTFTFVLPDGVEVIDVRS